MLEEIQKYIDEINNTKSGINKKELLSKLGQISSKIEKDVDSNALINIKSSGKLTVVDEIKPHDILYVSILGGVPHYMLVHKIIADKVYCLILTSTYKDYLILYQVKNDRYFKDKYVSNTYFCISLEEAKKSFVRVFEDKNESTIIFRKIVAYYKKLFI